MKQGGKYRKYIYIYMESLKIEIEIGEKKKI